MKRLGASAARGLGAALVIGLAVLASPASAQRLTPNSPPPDHPFPSYSPFSGWRVSADTGGASAFGERLLWAGIGGVLGMLGAAAVDGGRGDYDLLPFTYPAGAALGVLAATHAREGVRPWGVVGGAALGAALPLLLATRSEPSGDGDDPVGMAAGVLFLITVPFGAAWGHDWGH